jgi:hypothetical protein
MISLFRHLSSFPLGLPACNEKNELSQGEISFADCGGSRKGSMCASLGLSCTSRLR